MGLFFYELVAIDFTGNTLYHPFCWVVVDAGRLCVVDAGRLCVVDAGQAMARKEIMFGRFDERVTQLCRVLSTVIIQHNVGRIVYLVPKQGNDIDGNPAGQAPCLGTGASLYFPQLEINGVKAVSVGRREARRVLCGWTAMLHELEEQVETFFEFDVTIGGGCGECAVCGVVADPAGVGGRGYGADIMSTRCS